MSAFFLSRNILNLSTDPSPKPTACKIGVICISAFICMTSLVVVGVRKFAVKNTHIALASCPPAAAPPNARSVALSEESRTWWSSNAVVVLSRRERSRAVPPAGNPPAAAAPSAGAPAASPPPSCPSRTSSIVQSSSAFLAAAASRNSLTNLSPSPRSPAKGLQIKPCFRQGSKWSSMAMVV